LGRWQLHPYEIRRERIREIIATTSSGVPGFFEALGVCRYGIRVISKPGGAFMDHDEYLFQFNEPPVSEVVDTLRDIGYPL
jgi:hypothetical protein